MPFLSVRFPPQFGVLKFRQPSTQTDFLVPLGKDLPPTELQPADDFALLAGQAWVSAFEQSGKSRIAKPRQQYRAADRLPQTGTRHYLEHALALFEHVLLKSKYKYQIRILAINVLRLLGAPSLSVTHYRVFGVKNVQFDTLSHLMVARGSTFVITGPKEAGVFGETVSAMGWHGSGQTEAREMVVRAFTNEAYQKVSPALAATARPLLARFTLC